MGKGHRMVRFSPHSGVGIARGAQAHRMYCARLFQNIFAHTSAALCACHTRCAIWDSTVLAYSRNPIHPHRRFRGPLESQKLYMDLAIELQLQARTPSTPSRPRLVLSR